MPGNDKIKFLHVAVLAALFPVLLAAKNPPAVISIQPGAHLRIPTLSPEILVRFDMPIDTASINPFSFSVFGRWAGVAPGQYFFEDNNQQVRFLPQRGFAAGEVVTVSLSKNIKNAAGENLARGYAWSFMIAAQRGSFEMRESKRISVRRMGEGLVRTYGAYAGDLNADGYHDFTVPNEVANDVRVFMNDGAGGYSGGFKIFPLPANFTPSTNEGADFNGDGLLDFAVGNIQSGTAAVFMGDGLGAFAAAQIYNTGAGTRGLGILDLNGDGAPDIVTANRSASNVTLLLNRGDGTFAPRVILETGAGGETSCGIADANEDGVMDILVGGYDSDEIVVLLGDGNANLTVATKVNCRGDAWMIAMGDVDGDRHIDVVSANAGQRTFSVLRGEGTGQLSAAQVFNAGVFPLAIDLGDLDGDGDLDLVMSNYGSANFTVYENNGAGEFALRKTLPAAIAGSCAVLHDRDRDGDVDITGIDEEADLLFLFENPGAGTIVDGPPSTTPPNDFELLQSYPNPFVIAAQRGANAGQRLVIPFVLHQSERVRLEVVNLRGEIVKTVLNEDRAPGMHRAEVALQGLAPGVYFYRLRANRASSVRKLVILGNSSFQDSQP